MGGGGGGGGWWQNRENHLLGGDIHVSVYNTCIK